jgi:integrase
MTLKAKQIEHAIWTPKNRGMYADGNGLYLRVQESGSKSWIFRFQLDGKRREMGIGTLADRSAVDARGEAAKLSTLVRSGVDPIVARQREKEARIESAAKVAAGATTFSQVAEDYIKAHRAGWRNAKHADQWTNTLEKYAAPVIGAKPVADVSTEDVLRILQPMWNEKTETATRVRSRIELVLSYAKALKLRQGENPAAWRGHLDALLPKPTKLKNVRHHPALPYDRMPEFMEALRKITGGGARALELAILTAARSGEVRLATWSEFDLEAGVWTIPAARMKAGKEHRIPLSDAALALLDDLPAVEGVDYLFPGERAKKPLSDMSLSAVTRRMNEGEKPAWIEPQTGAQVVPHGFRSSFRDWAGETTSHPREVVEHALAHQLQDKAEAAYARGTLFDKRKKLMQEWAAWCEPRKTAKVVPIKSKKSKAAA